MTVVKKKLSASVKYVKYSAAKPGETVALGVFKGTELVPAFDPTAPHVPQHTIIDEDGTEVKLNSAGQLNHILKSVEPGTPIEVVYLGKEKIKSKTGRVVEANQFEVNELVDEEDVA
jgi:hypothetical protein